MQSYGKDLNLEEKIEEIRVYVNGLESSLKNDAAKRCIARISNPDYSFTDSSNVSTRQLLALAFTLFMMNQNVKVVSMMLKKLYSFKVYMKFNETIQEITKIKSTPYNQDYYNHLLPFIAVTYRPMFHECPRKSMDF